MLHTEREDGVAASIQQQEAIEGVSRELLLVYTDEGSQPLPSFRATKRRRRRRSRASFLPTSALEREATWTTE